MATINLDNSMKNLPSRAAVEQGRIVTSGYRATLRIPAAVPSLEWRHPSPDSPAMADPDSRPTTPVVGTVKRAGRLEANRFGRSALRRTKPALLPTFTRTSTDSLSHSFEQTGHTLAGQVAGRGIGS